MLARPIWIAWEDVRIDDQQPIGPCLMCGDVVRRTETGIAWQDYQRNRQSIEQARVLRLAQQRLGHLGTVRHVNELIVIDAREAGVEAVLQKEILWPAIETHYECAASGAPLRTEALDVGS